MKVLFLDIDGVLNSELFFKSRLKNKLNFKFFKFFGLKKLYHWLINANDKEKWLLSQIDEKSVKRLTEIVEETCCKIVISSTWRKFHSTSYIQELLEKKGFRGEIIDSTPILGAIRGQEVLAWLSSFTGNVTNYIILDDDSDFTDYQKLNHFIHCDNYIGLSPNVAYKAKMYLNRNKSKIVEMFEEKELLIKQLQKEIERL